MEIDLTHGAARRRRPVGPPADQEPNFVGLLVTKKINTFIFFGLAAACVAARKKKSDHG